MFPPKVETDDEIESYMVFLVVIVSLIVVGVSIESLISVHISPPSQEKGPELTEKEHPQFDPSEHTPMDIHELMSGDEIDLADGLWFIDKVRPNADRTAYVLELSKATISEEEANPASPAVPSAQDLDIDTLLEEHSDGRHEDGAKIKTKAPEDW